MYQCKLIMQLILMICFDIFFLFLLFAVNFLLFLVRDPEIRTKTSYVISQIEGGIMFVSSALMLLFNVFTGYSKKYRVVVLEKIGIFFMNFALDVSMYSCFTRENDLYISMMPFVIHFFAFFDFVIENMFISGLNEYYKRKEDVEKNFEDDSKVDSKLPFGFNHSMIKDNLVLFNDDSSNSNSIDNELI